MQLVILHDVEGSRTPGIRALVREAETQGFRVDLPESPNGWWPGETLNQQMESRSIERACLVGVGSGGQVAFRSAYSQPRRWPIVAAVAPACDLGRWYGRGSEIDGLYSDPTEARQDEAPLYFNPLSRPLSQLCWCDPRDAACLPSALRLTSKSTSSGVPIDADLETELGDSRDEYLRLRSGDLAAWLADAWKKVENTTILPIL